MLVSDVLERTEWLELLRDMVAAREIKLRAVEEYCSVARYLRKIFQDSYDGSFAQGYT
jgi:hypothetical protein